MMNMLIHWEFQDPLNGATVLYKAICCGDFPFQTQSSLEGGSPNGGVSGVWHQGLCQPPGGEGGDLK